MRRWHRLRSSGGSSSCAACSMRSWQKRRRRVPPTDRLPPRPPINISCCNSGSSNSFTRCGEKPSTSDSNSSSIGLPRQAHTVAKRCMSASSKCSRSTRPATSLSRSGIASRAAASQCQPVASRLRCPAWNMRCRCWSTKNALPAVLWCSVRASVDTDCVSVSSTSAVSASTTGALSASIAMSINCVPASRMRFSMPCSGCDSSTSSSR